MCGIVCVLRKRDLEIDKRATYEMLDVIRHRGPDCVGDHTSGGLSIGMARLSIIDPASTGLCPYVVPDGAPGSAAPAVIAFNGEIFNYIELRDELKAHGVVFETSCDTEVLLKAYLHWGPECLDKLNGMFAFVIADYANDLLFAARDIAGEKPLYYCETDKELLIASEIKAILRRTGTPEMLCSDEFRAFEYVTGAETLFKGIYSLLPAHKMIVKGIRGNFSGLTLERYWDIGSSLIEVPSERRSIDMLDELLNDSVRLRLRSDVPWGLYLSGGIDSSLLAYIAKPAVAFSIHFGVGKPYDEIEHAKTVADDLGCEHITIKAGKKDFEESLDTAIYHLDMPVGSFSVFPLFMLAREASRRVKVVLSGEGADELFSGYTRYLLPFRDQQAFDEPELENYHSLLDLYYGSPLDRFVRLLNRGLVPDEVVRAVIAPHFERFDDIRHAMGYTEFKLMLVTLLQMEDRMSAAFGLENRSPFLDKRIIAFAFSIPPDLKMRGRSTKFIVREVAKRYIPESISARTEKCGLIAPVNRWLGFGGPRGEFDRRSYSELCLTRWREIFYEKRWFERSRERLS